MQFELTKEYVDTLKAALQNGDENSVMEMIAELHAADVAEIFDEINVEEAQKLYQLIEPSKAADILIELEEEVRDKFLASLSSKEIAEQFIDNLDSDDAADVISKLPESKKEEVLAHIEDVDVASDIVDLLHYPEGTAGSLMGKELVKVHDEWTVAQSIRELRTQVNDVDHVYTIYVIDEKERLLGTVSLKSFLYVSAKSKIKEFYMDGIKSVKATTPSDDVAKMMEKYDLVVLPVVDDLGRLIGRITIDDVVDVIIEESEKDYQMASGLSENVDSQDKVWVLTRARLPWLLIGLLGGIFGAQVIGLYEEELKIYPEMAFFIPLIAAMGGNVGVQSSAIIVQGLANDSLGTKGMFSRLTKEFSVALINGVICSLVIMLYNTVFSNSMELSITVSLALFSVIIFAAIFGTFIPLLLDKYKIDPALATGPFITTMNDIIGLFLYFMIGRMMYL